MTQEGWVRNSRAGGVGWLKGLKDQGKGGQEGQPAPRHLRYSWQHHDKCQKGNIQDHSGCQRQLGSVMRQ